LCAQFDQPLVFKNTTWCSIQSDLLYEILPNSIFIFITRSIMFAAQSVLIGRRRRYGSDKIWWSNRPSTYRRLIKLEPHEQVVRQIIDFSNETSNALVSIPGNNVIFTNYEDICRSPKSIIKRICDATKFDAVYDNIPDHILPRNIRVVSKSDWDKLNGALQNYENNISFLR